MKKLIFILAFFNAISINLFSQTSFSSLCNTHWVTNEAEPLYSLTITCQESSTFLAFSESNERGFAINGNVEATEVVSGTIKIMIKPDEMSSLKTPVNEIVFEVKIIDSQNISLEVHSKIFFDDNTGDGGWDYNLNSSNILKFSKI